MSTDIKQLTVLENIALQIFIARLNSQRANVDVSHNAAMSFEEAKAFIKVRNMLRRQDS